MEITTTGSGTANHELATTQAGGQKQTAAHQERQDLLEADEQKREGKGINPSINVFA